MMTQDLTDYVTKFISLTPGEIEIISNLKIFKQVKKGTLLLKEGLRSSECYLVLKGCLRSYYIVDGEEKTTDFFMEGQPIVPISYTQKKLQNIIYLV
jgi:CRP-like cAMP-binding protein